MLTTLSTLCAFVAAAFAQASSPPLASAQSVVLLGTQQATNGKFGRDLSFSGRVGNRIINTYGDSTRCNVKGAFKDCILPSASDGVSLATTNPLQVTDWPKYLTASGLPQQFCPFYPDEPHGNGQWSVGITTIMPITPTEGMLFFSVNYRAGKKPDIQGAGVARIDSSDPTQAPTCTRLQNSSATGHASEYWWSTDAEAVYGDYAAVLGRDGYIYGFGARGGYIFLARVLQANYADVTKYQYWNGKSYQDERLYNPTFANAVFKSRGQSTALWSPHHNAYLMVDMYLGKLEVKLSYLPEGPWSNVVSIYQGKCSAGLCPYTPSVEPWWDYSGKSLIITYSDPGTFALNVLNVTWAGRSIANASASPWSPDFVANAPTPSGSDNSTGSGGSGGSGGSSNPSTGSDNSTSTDGSNGSGDSNNSSSADDKTAASAINTPNLMAALLPLVVAAVFSAFSNHFNWL